LGLRDDYPGRKAGVVKGVIQVAILLAAFGSVPAVGQEVQPGGLDSASVVQLRPDRFVRIQVPGMGRFSGHVGFHTATELLLKVEGENRTISLGAVDTLWVRGRRTKTGAIIGGILGIGGGVFLGALAEALCEYSCEGDYIIGGGLFGGVAGGVTGAIIGTAIPRWKRVFPR
jgi:hypothetical protein